jgi:hypothetical protein
VETRGRRAYFVAIATMNDGGVAHGNFEDLLSSLPSLWEYISTHGNFDPVIVPVLGSGYSRLSQPREEIVREIVKSFVAACASSRPTERLTIAIPYKDCYEHRVDLDELERFVQHVCRYTEYQSAAAAGAGIAIA